MRKGPEAVDAAKREVALTGVLVLVLVLFFQFSF
jgi:hypothetical protein